MTIGPECGRVVSNLIATSKPMTMMELGCYIGYSAIKFGSDVQRSGGLRYYSLESNPDYAAIARILVELAGLQDFIQIIVGPSTDSLAQLARMNPDLRIDFLFVDHAEELYLTDLQLAERLSLLQFRSYVVADNVGSGRSRNYVEWLTTAEIPGPTGTRTTSNLQNTEGHLLYESRVYERKLPNGEMVRCLI